MSVFRFRLACVLGWYEKKCEAEECRLASALAALNDVEIQIDRLRGERDAVDREIIARGSITAPEFSALGLYRLRATHVAAELDALRGQREMAITEQREKVKEARRRVRLLEKLRERKLFEHKYTEQLVWEAVAEDAFRAAWMRRENTSPATAELQSEPD